MKTTSTTSMTMGRTGSSLGLAEKQARLETIVSAFDSALIAFSGGVDSTYLSHYATRLLGSRALCVTAESPSYPRSHRAMAERIARDFALRHEFIETSEMDRADYRANPVNRCYFCKHELFVQLTSLARERGIAVIFDGNNADDRGDYRPGRTAAREFGVRSPLDEAGLTKDDIRELSRLAGLPTWDIPASACLSSRIPYSSEVTTAKLEAIERGESVLRDLGFRVCRVRHHDTIARIELGTDEIVRALDPELRQAVVDAFRALGFHYVTLDLQGYRLGSLNERILLTPQ